jgi:hypothetical protein
LLVGYLAAAWLPQRMRVRGMWLAGVLFAVYPFAYQAVLFVGALYHPLAALLILGALTGHQAYRASGQRSALGISMACVLSAPFAHETGLIAGPLLGLSEVAWAQAHKRRPIWPIVASACAASIAGLLAWLATPRTGPVTQRPDLSGVVINLTYAVQGLIYPAGPIARVIIGATGASDQSVMWIGGGLLSVAAIVIARKAGCLRVLLIGGGVWLIGALPYALTLAPSYVLAAPRLLYTPGIGATLAWTAGLLGLASFVGQAQRTRAVVAAVAVSAIAIFGVWFARQRSGSYQLLGEALWDLAATTQAHAGDRSALVVNFPRLARSTQAVFPLGVESALFFGQHSDLAAGLTVNGVAAPDEVRTITFGNLMPPLDYTILTMGRDADWPDLAQAIAAADRVYRAYPSAEAIAVRETGRIQVATSNEPLIRFGGAVDLLSADLSRIEAGVLALRLRWGYRGGADDVQVFVHILNDRGELVAQSDGVVMDMLPFWQWPVDQEVEEVRYLALPDALVAAQVNVGLYDAVTGERLTPVDVRGAIYRDGSAPLYDIDSEAGVMRALIAR